MELHELQILIRQIRPRHHSRAVTSARVRWCAGEVRASVSTGGQHRVLGVETMQRAVFKAKGDDTTALAVFHQQIKGEVLDEVVAVVAQRLAVKRVQEWVTRTIGHAAAAMGLAALAEFERLSTESALVDLAWKWVEMQLIIE